MRHNFQSHHRERLFTLFTPPGANSVATQPAKGLMDDFQADRRGGISDEFTAVNVKRINNRMQMMATAAALLRSSVCRLKEITHLPATIFFRPGIKCMIILDRVYGGN